MHGGMYQPLVVKTPVKKGPYQESVSNLLMEDSFDCDLRTFLEQVLRVIVVPKG